MPDYKLAIIVEGEDRGAESMLGRLGGALGGLGKAALTLGGGGLLALGTGLGAGTVEGWKFNNSMEIVNAQLMAFTKDGAKSAEIMEMIRTRAAKTPFEFEAMAKAATALLPASKASGQGLESLIASAEILAASNPAEGLEGAAFALKEALSGDFTSIIERFNLPRQRLNELKAQGVPAMEAVGIAMRELGLDADLVTNLANTASGRFSTLKDTVTSLFGTLTQPVFKLFSDGLAALQPILDANMPAMTAFAETIGGQIASGIQQVGTFITTTLLPAGQELLAWFTAAGDGSSVLGGVLDQLSGVWVHLQEVVGTVAAGYQAIIDAVLPIVQQFIADHGAEIMAFFQGAWNQIVSIITIALDLYNAIVPPILQAIAGLISEHGDELGQLLSNAWTIISNIIQAALTLIQGVLKVALQLIQGDWSGAWETVKETVRKVWSNILQAMGAALDSLKLVIGGVIKWIQDEWGKLVDWALDIGGGIIQGIIDGVSGGIGALEDAVRNAAQSALDAAKRLLGIASPSKAFAYVGDMSMAGWAGGISAGIPRVAGATTGAARASVASAVSVGGITVNGAPGQPVDQLADLVIQRLEQRVRGYL